MFRTVRDRRNSSFQYRGQATDVRNIAAELGVHCVLEGRQQKGGDRLRVTVQLIDALAGNHIWAERYDRSLEDLFTVQDDCVVGDFQASPLSRRLAATCRRIEFVILPTDRIPPVASHPASRRRSVFW